MTRLPDPTTRPLLTVPEVVDALDGVLGRSAVYEVLNRGEIPGARRLGRRVLVSNVELRSWFGLDVADANGTANGDSPP